MADKGKTALVFVFGAVCGIGAYATTPSIVSSLTAAETQEAVLSEAQQKAQDEYRAGRYAEIAFVEEQVKAFTADVKSKMPSRDTGPEALKWQNDFRTACTLPKMQYSGAGFSVLFAKEYSKCLDFAEAAAVDKKISYNSKAVEQYAAILKDYDRYPGADAMHSVPAYKPQ